MDERDADGNVEGRETHRSQWSMGKSQRWDIVFQTFIYVSFTGFIFGIGFLLRQVLINTPTIAELKQNVENDEKAEVERGAGLWTAHVELESRTNRSDKELRDEMNRTNDRLEGEVTRLNQRIDNLATMCGEAKRAVEEVKAKVESPKKEWKR